jgi:hypothetical protein
MSGTHLQACTRTDIHSVPRECLRGVTFCEHCKQVIELRTFQNHGLRPFHWWSHIGGSDFCASTKATPKISASEPTS